MQGYAVMYNNASLNCGVISCNEKGRIMLLGGSGMIS